MIDQIIDDLSCNIDPSICTDLVHSYQNSVSRFHKGDIEGCLSAVGKFVENTLRAIEFIRTGKRLKEIKHVATTVTAIENDKNLPESLRILVPRIARSMIYDIRSKTGAVHVKEINPRYMDASLAIQAASWVTAEFLRLYHKSSESEVSIAMAALMRTHVPFVESFRDEVVVTRPVKCELELLLL